MEKIVPLLLALIFSIGICAMGRYMVRNPTAGEKLFFWAPRAINLYFRVAGRFFFIMGIISITFCTISIVVKLIK